MKPRSTFVTLFHHVIRIVWHLTRAVYGDFLRLESSGGCFVFESAEIVFRRHSLQLCVAFEGVYIAFPFDRVSALNVYVVRQENFFGTMKLSPATFGFFRSVIPSSFNFHVISPVDPHLLYLRHIRGFGRLLIPHQDGIVYIHELVTARDRAGIHEFLAGLAAAHGMVAI